MLKHLKRTVLYKNINILKNQMIKSGMENGISSPETIKYSQELDKMIYQYQRMVKSTY
ncbi:MULTISPECIES: aspartyl-phosphate phosphatase Spo0E family protein [Bacillaceae]|uniref:Stage 0 sporulation regulatory protein n=1 Tax=Peribacillus huizhouensis TaxID=1501239 RepID=A0ABR6CSZ8_9BACI|nr:MULTISPECIES: aspartyl-phosphate phosphatase Spo0E family protein [Bacillaceae]MBA9027477.1 stage 0 sporulation regulatory protein [Peribacillus huizhouensis]